jgi:chemotaxis protein histidine kinase CheA
MTDVLMEELRVRFRETAAVRLHEMASLLDALERDRGDGVSLEKLARHFHALAGLGATYGFPRITELGDEAEDSIASLARGAKSPTESLLARWRELVAAVTTELC